MQDRGLAEAGFPPERITVQWRLPSFLSHADMIQPFEQPALPLYIEKGLCFVLFAYDVGSAIKLDQADREIKATKERGRIKRQRAAPQYFDYHPPPLRVAQDQIPLSIGDWKTGSSVDVVLYDFGAISVTYRIPIEGEFTALRTLSELLYENTLLLTESRTRIENLVNAIRGAVEKPEISPFVEDYSIFHIEYYRPTLASTVLIDTHKQALAQILRCEAEHLSEEEVQDAISCRISFGTDDITVIDWNGSLMFGQEMDDVRAVLEFANVELLERRYLDQQLDNTLDHAYEVLTKRSFGRSWWPGSFHGDLRRIAQLQVDSALLFERVTNTLKLLGDQYLARVYRQTSQRFHLRGWDTSILRKLETIDSIYGKMADQTGNRRMEVLEWIIIVLIAMSIILPFIPGFPGY